MLTHIQPPNKHKTFDSVHFINLYILAFHSIKQFIKWKYIGRLFNRQFYGLWPCNTKRLRMFIQSESQRNNILCFCILFRTPHKCIEICEIVTGFIGCDEKFIVWRYVNEYSIYPDHLYIIGKCQIWFNVKLCRKQKKNYITG